MAFTVDADVFKSACSTLNNNTEIIVNEEILHVIDASNCAQITISPGKRPNIILDCGITYSTYLSGFAIATLQAKQIAKIGTGYCMDAYELNNILNSYEELVQHDKCEKVSYDSWKTLKRISSYTGEISYWRDLDHEVPEGYYFYCEGVSHMACLTGWLPKELILMLFDPKYSKYKKENNKTMNMPTMKFDFGPVDSNSISLSPYGMAVITPNGTALTYDSANGQTIDVTGFTFDFKGMIYKVPTAVNQIQTGDMVMHNGKPMYVIDNCGTSIDAIDILESEAKTIIPITNMFGFNFVTKVVSFLNFGNTTPSPDQPFGNLMPIMVASMVFGDGKNGTPFGDMDFGKMMMMSTLMGGTSPFGNMFNFGTVNQNNTSENNN